MALIEKGDVDQTKIRHLTPKVVIKFYLHMIWKSFTHIYLNTVSKTYK